MLKSQRKIIIPIGCSCINQFQIDFYFGNSNLIGSLFDWNVTTPGTTVQVMRCIQAGAAHSLFEDRSHYELESGYLKHAFFEGLYFWHENGRDIMDTKDSENFALFAGKVCHLIDNMTSFRDNVHLIWSNIQPNLRSAVGDVGLRWDAFRLTRQRYADIKLEAGSVFNAPCFTFISREEDVEGDVAAQDDVIVMDVPRGTDFKGGKDLYREVFDSIMGA
jgi:hypothetical protein